MSNKLFFTLFVAITIAVAGCTTDALPEPVEMPCTDLQPTYETEIQAIIEQTCAYDGCHLGTAPGVYVDYAGLSRDLNSGSFRQRVVEQRTDANRGMPPNYAPEGRPVDLTDRQLEMIVCWLEAGHPER